MDISEYKTSHYQELKGFWSQYGWSAPSEDLLPRKGYVAIHDGKIVAAAFVYRSCSGMAMLDWVIGNKEAEAQVRGKGVYKAVQACKDYAKQEGFKVLYTITGNKNLQETYRMIGFQDMEQNITSMAMSLDGSQLDFLKE